MSGISIGDMAQQFASLRNGAAIKTELANLVDSLSTGKVNDLTKSLNGETTRYSGLSYSLTQLDGYRQVVSETQQTLANVQIVLNKVDGSRSAAAERLLLVSDSSTHAQIDVAAHSSRGTFVEIVQALNTQIGDRALLSGDSVGTAPLAPAEGMLADIQAAVGGALDHPTILSAVDSWFNDPAGGFMTRGYLGDTGPPSERQITENKLVTINARADDPSVRQVLRGAALAALANDLPGLDQATKTELLKSAGSTLYDAASAVVAVQARVGFAEAGADRALAEMNAQQTSLRLAQNELSLADPFETASRLQATQLQLETHFSVTARMSQLSLLRFI